MSKFNTWADHLYLCVDVAETDKQMVSVNLQQDGGFQNIYIYGRRVDGGVLVDRSKRDQIFSITSSDQEIFRGGIEVDDGKL